MTGIGINAARVLVTAALVLGLACCGGGSADGSGATNDTTPVGTTPADPAPIREGQARDLPPNGGCGGAVVRLGSVPGSIDFTLKCRPYPGDGKVRFAVGLTPISPERGVRVRGFRRHPEVREAGSPPRHGTCRLYGGGIACFSHIRLLTAVRGRIWVRQRDKCDARVVITESRPADPCTSACTDEATATIVVQARPRGC